MEYSLWGKNMQCHMAIKVNCNKKAFNIHKHLTEYLDVEKRE